MLAAFDLDDTLAPINRAMAPEVARRLVGLQNGGVVIALASGKPCAYLAGYARAYLRAGDTVLIGENGSDTWLTGIMPGERITGLVPDETQAELDRVASGLRQEFGEHLFFQPNVVNVTAFPLPGAGITPAHLREYVGSLSPIGTTIYEHADSVDCVPAGLDKGSALRAVLERLGVSSADAVAVGDGENDIPMFPVVGVSICVGDDPLCSAAAAHRVPSVGDALSLIEARLEA